MPNSRSLHTATPCLRAIDGRGQVVREILYHRCQPGAAEARITRHQHDAQGRLTQSIDPRLYAAQLEDPTVAANYRQRTSLSGTLLLSESVDAGRQITLHDSLGRDAITWLANGVQQVKAYESAPLPGRLLNITEHAPDAPARVSERCVWAAPDTESKGLNLAGQRRTHFDTGGKLQVHAMSLFGSTLRESRQLLEGAGDSDWADHTALGLESSVFTTTVSLDAYGSIIALEDAKGHRQRHAYDLAGQPRASWMTLAGGTEQAIVVDTTYNASGQKLRAVDGNGIVTSHTYAPHSQWLTGLSTVRTRDGKILQDLHYRHDPVGLVIQVRNDAEQTRFWRNQKIAPQQDYRYDSLSQLVHASGRQMAALGQPSGQMPSPMIPLPADSNAYTLYNREYEYDSGGNLLRIRHSSPATNGGFTTELTVSSRSNRAVLTTLCADPAQVDSHFDAAGQQLALDGGRQLRWNARKDLACVLPGTGTGERYLYDSEHQRLRKTHEQGVSRYLPSLELHELGAQLLHCIKLGERIRVLHWPTGRPDGIDNDQIRYSYCDVLGSHGLEIGGNGEVISREEFFPFGSTAVWACRSQIEASYKTVRYSGKERDSTGLYYYGYRYYQPWAGRWLSADPAGAVDGLNLYAMVRNSPVSAVDEQGLMLRAAVKGAIGAGGVGYEAYKYHKNQQPAESAPPSVPKSSASFGDQRAEAFTAKVHESKENYSPLQQIASSVTGRFQAVDHVAHGQIPGAEAVVKSASMVGNLAEFSQTGDVNQLAKAPLAAAAAKDVAHSAKQSIVATVKAGKTAAQAATLSEDGVQQIHAATQEYKGLLVDKAVTAGGFGATVSAGLEVAGAAMPHPVGKAVVKVAAKVWSAAGAVYTAEQLGKLADEHKELTSNHTGQNLMDQVKQINTQNRGSIMSRVKEAFASPPAP
jgi:insecticidal toxin complex protein TccC